MFFGEFVTKYKEALKNEYDKGLKKIDELSFWNKVYLLLLLITSVAFIVLSIIYIVSHDNIIRQWMIITGIAYGLVILISLLTVDRMNRQDDAIRKAYIKRINAVEEVYRNNYSEFEYKRYLEWIVRESDKKIEKQRNIEEKIKISTLFSICMSFITSLPKTQNTLSVVFGFCILFFIAWLLIKVIRIKIDEYYRVFSDLSDALSYYLISDYKKMAETIKQIVSINGNRMVCFVRKIE